MIQNRQYPRRIVKKAMVLMWLFLSAGIIYYSAGSVTPVKAATVEDLKQSLQEQVDELETKIQENQKLIEQYRKQSGSLQRDINIYDKQIGQISLEIEQMKLSIKDIQDKIARKMGEIDETEDGLAVKKDILGKYLKEIYESEDRSLVEMIFKNRRLSELFDDLNSFDIMQTNVHQAISEVQNFKGKLIDQKADLDEKKNDVLSLKAMVDIQKRSLEIERNGKDKIMKDSKGKEVKYAVLMEENKKTLERLRQELSYLEQAGISTLDAINYARLVAARTGIRPAFLLAILEIESELGANVGRGNWRDDMYECYLRYGKKSVAASLKDAFMSITKKLGLNPDSVPVSKKPDYGCGGALGPAQFLPTTWLAYEAQVAGLTGHNPPSPWNTEDAFMAAGLKLAEGGADDGTRAGEDRAARAYIGGNPTCAKSICNIYARKALNLAATLEEQLENQTF